VPANLAAHSRCDPGPLPLLVDQLKPGELIAFDPSGTLLRRVFVCLGHRRSPGAPRPPSCTCSSNACAGVPNSASSFASDLKRALPKPVGARRKRLRCASEKSAASLIEGARPSPVNAAGSDAGDRHSRGWRWGDIRTTTTNGRLRFDYRGALHCLFPRNARHRSPLASAFPIFDETNPIPKPAHSARVLWGATSRSTPVWFGNRSSAPHRCAPAFNYSGFGAFFARRQGRLPHPGTAVHGRRRKE
jgi:hypothetical protein